MAAVTEAMMAAARQVLLAMILALAGCTIARPSTPPGAPMAVPGGGSDGGGSGGGSGGSM